MPCCTIRDEASSAKGKQNPTAVQCHIHMHAINQTRGISHYAALSSAFCTTISHYGVMKQALFTCCNIIRQEA